MEIFYVNFSVGSGIERTGDRVLKMLENIGHVTEYKLQNPPTIIIEEIIKAKPDVIVMNEFFTIVIIATSYYNKLYPSVNTILLNHVLSTLKGFPITEDTYQNLNEDGALLINHFMNNEVDHIINLNWKPDDDMIPERLERKLIRSIHPVDIEYFCIKVPFADREKDFMYYGNVSEHKLSSEFLNAINGTNIHIDVYGNIIGDDEYTKLVNDNDNINYMGYIKEDELIDTINEYRFFINARSGPEPFMLTGPESILCGCIPMIYNGTNPDDSDWLTHMKDVILEYPTLEEMIGKMELYLTGKHDNGLINVLDETSRNNALIMKERVNPDNLEKILRKLIL